MNLIPVKDNSGLARDPKSKAIVAVDNVGVKRYKNLRSGRQSLTNQLDQKDRKIKELEQRLQRIEDFLFSKLGNN